MNDEQLMNALAATARFILSWELTLNDTTDPTAYAAIEAFVQAMREHYAHIAQLVHQGVPDGD